MRRGWTLSLLVGGSLVLLPVVGGERASAQECSVNSPCQLFAEEPAFVPTAPGMEFRTKTKEVVFSRRRQTAHIAGAASVEIAIAIDNFLAINGDCREGANICAGRPYQSCFDADRARPDLADEVVAGRMGMSITEIVGAIPPVDVSDFIVRGTNSFTLCDLGPPAGNTDLWLVISNKPPSPDTDPDFCLDSAAATRDRELGPDGSCAGGFDACLITLGRKESGEPGDCVTIGQIGAPHEKAARPDCECTIANEECKISVENNYTDQVAICNNPPD